MSTFHVPANVQMPSLDFIDCSKCGQYKPHELFKKLPSEIRINYFGDERDIKNRLIITNLTTVASRYRCGECVNKEENMNKIFDDIIQITMANKFNGFLKTYSDICEAYRFGFGKFKDEACVYTDISLVRTQKFWDGKYIHYDLSGTEFFERVIEIFDDEPIANTDDQKTNGYVKAGKFAVPEFKEFMAWIKEQAPDCIYSLKLFFEEKKLPQYMKECGYPYRSPDAYNNFLTRVQKKDKGTNKDQWHGVINGKPELIAMMKEISALLEKKKVEKHSIGNNVQSAVNDAMSGAFSKDARERDRGRKKKKESNEAKDHPLSNAHSENTNIGKKKLKHNEQQLEYQGQSVKYQGDMAASLKGIAMGTWTDDDYIGDLLEHIETEYDDVNRVGALLESVKRGSKQRDWLLFWRACKRKSYDVQMINDRINHKYREWNIGKRKNHNLNN